MTENWMAEPGLSLFVTFDDRQGRPSNARG
jgi:hypothetical protein